MLMLADKTRLTVTAQPSGAGSEEIEVNCLCAGGPHTIQNYLGILGYGCIYACAWLCHKSQMKHVTFFLGTKNIHRTQHKNSDIQRISTQIKSNTKI